MEELGEMGFLGTELPDGAHAGDVAELLEARHAAADEYILVADCRRDDFEFWILSVQIKI